MERRRLAKPTSLLAVAAQNGIAPKDIDQHVSEDGATLVVAGAVASGRSLLGVSQLLRYIQKNGAINYIIGLARLPADESYRELRGNVSYGERPHDHGFHEIERIFLPIHGPQVTTSWDDEIELLKQLAHACDDANTRHVLEQRQNAIRQAASTTNRGMDNALFWRSANSTSELPVRQGFAFFFDFSNRDSRSQADMYFTIVAVLHHLRLQENAVDSLRQQQHVRKLLSPRCFERFNDGVIQGSLLRAALPAELDYSVSKRYSGEMTQVLDFIFSHNDSEPGEATREFLLALALGKLQLLPRDLNALKTKYEYQTSDPVAALFWSTIR